MQSRSRSRISMVLCLGRDTQTRSVKDLNKAVLNFEPPSTPVTMPDGCNCRNSLPGVGQVAGFGNCGFQAEKAASIRPATSARRGFTVTATYIPVSSCQSLCLVVGLG